MYSLKKTSTITLLILAALCSCKQSKKAKSAPVVVETVNTVRNYRYADEDGNSLVIQNSLPRGASYTAPDGNEYFKVIFWTRMINQTTQPLDFHINFPENAYEAPGFPGSYYKILIPPDTMRIDREQQYDYGMADLKTFLDNNLQKPASLKRTVKPGDSTAFYMVLLNHSSKTTPGSTFRTGFVLKDRQLIYRISRYSSKEGLPLLSQKEIECGSINLKDLVLQQ